MESLSAATSVRGRSGQWFHKAQKRWIFSAISSQVDLKFAGHLRVGTWNSLHVSFWGFYYLFTFRKLKQTKHTTGVFLAVWRQSVPKLGWYLELNPMHNAEVPLLKICHLFLFHWCKQMSQICLHFEKSWDSSICVINEIVIVKNMNSLFS